MERLRGFTDSLLEKRKKAIDARTADGFDARVMEDEEFYDGIDDANREEMRQSWTKPATPGGPITRDPRVRSSKSTVFPNITQTYVDMAAAAVADMLLPTDDKPFAVKPTPEPDLVAAKKDPTPFRVQGPSGEMMEANAGEIATRMIEEAEASAKRAETKIWDWLTEGRWHTEVRAMIDATAKIGTGVLKGPLPATVRSRKVQQGPNGEVEIVMQTKVNPVSRHISAKNLYPDPACGEDIHRGSYVWEFDKISARALRELKNELDQDGNPLYMHAQIDKILEEGPGKKYLNGPQPTREEADADDYPLWYYYGMAEREDFLAAGCDCPEGKVYPVHVVMVGDEPIKVARSMLDSGAFPYDVMIWQRIPGKWYGTGEARRVRTAQRGLTGAVRAMNNNAGLSSGPQIVFNSDLIEPADGVFEITPLKLWRKKQGKDLPDVSKAIIAINIDSRQEQLLNIITFYIELADKIATMPIQQQGNQGVTQETAEGRRILQNNASVTKRRLAKLFDDRITEPHIAKYYEWILLWEDDPELKKEFVIDAVGSSVLFERDAQNIAIAQMAPFVKDPAFGMNPRKWAEEWAKSNKLDPKRFSYTDEELEEMAKQPQPKDPRIEAAEIAAKARLQVAKVDSDRDTQYHQVLSDREKNQQDYLERKSERDYELALLKYANDRRITLEKAKAELAKTAMTLRAQREMHDEPPAGAPQVARPKAEPKGRAPDGEAFER